MIQMKKFRLVITLNDEIYYGKPDNWSKEKEEELFNFLKERSTDTSYIIFPLENNKKLFVPGQNYMRNCSVVIEVYNEENK